MDRIKLKQFIKNGVDSKTREQGEKDYQSQLAKDAKEEFGMEVSEFNARVKAAFDLHKAKENRDKLIDIVDDVETMGF